MGKIKKSLKRFVFKVARKLKGWYREGQKSEFVSKNTTNYRLEKEGKLTVETKKESIAAGFKHHLGYHLNWGNPRSFNEKIMWLKVNYQNPLIVRCIDKFAVKGYVDEVLGEGHVVPTIDWWTNPNDIDFDKLPDKFVLKVNWASGFHIIVQDKSKLDQAAARKQIRQWLVPNQNTYYRRFNWGYKYSSPVVYAEEYISEVGDSSQVYDYKFFCYNGVCKNQFITTDRFTNKTYNWLDRDFNALPFTYGHAGKTPGGVKKPKHYEEMIAYAEKLAKPFPFVRVDFYEVGDRVMVGEMTFYCGGGILPFEPREWDYKMGEFIELPEPVYFDDIREADFGTRKEHYLLENELTFQEKLNFCEQKGFGQLLYWPNLTQPRSYSEKLLWLALHYSNPVIAQASDKYEMKDLVARTAGEQYVVPTIGVYDDINDIDWDSLPERFAFKSTASWDGRNVGFILHKRFRNESVFKASLTDWLYPWNTYYYETMCVTEQTVKPRILIEELLGDDEHPLTEYGFYCAYGEAKMAVVPCGKKGGRKTFVDATTWDVMSLRKEGVDKASKAIKPKNLDEMLTVCQKLSADVPWVRVDLYEVDGRIYVGGVNFDPDLFTRMEPVENEFELGEMIDLTRIDPANLRDLP